MVLILLLLGCAAAAFGQVASAILLGDVRDESSALAPDVRVTARHLATGFTRTAVTGSEGSYRIEQLLPGNYTVTAEKPGFRSVAVRGVVLEVNQKARLDVELRIGPAQDSITVTATLSPLQTGDATAGYRLDHATAANLPLAQRNVISLVTLGPGAIPRHLGGFVHDVINDVQEGSRGAVALNPPVNGSRSTTNAFLLDGAYDTDRSTYALAVNPPMEAVQEFRIQSALAPAEFAQAGGGVVDLVTKAGSRSYHGSAFNFFRNEAMDARNFFDDPVLQRPVFRQNQFGGSLSGPMPFASAFFFVTYEGLRGKSAKPSLVLVPDQTLRSGDFQGRNAIFDPLNISGGGTRQPFAGNRIPASRADPIAGAFLDRYEPLPNRSGGSANYLDSTPNRRTNDVVSGRADREWSRHGRLFGRYTINEERGRTSGAFPVRPTSERLRAQQAALGHVLAGSSWLNEARFSFTRLRLFDVPESAFRTNVAAELGIKDPPSDPFTFGLPTFLVTNFSTLTDSPSLPQVQRDNAWSLAEAVSIAGGRHTWKFGFQWIHFQLNYLQSRNARGRYTFTGAFTSSAGSPTATGDAFADFLLGFPQVTSRNVGSPQSYLRQNSYAAYAQDDWRVNSRLTVNFGLRYEYVSPFTERRSRLLNLDYSGLPAPPALRMVGAAVAPDRNDFAPRAGLALRLPGAFGRRHEAAFRAGYGIYFSPEIAVETYDLILNGIRTEINQTEGARPPVLTIRDGFQKTAVTGFPSYFGLDERARTPYVQQWMASLQQAMPSGVLAEAAYIGSKGTRLGRFRRFNTPLHAVTGENLPPRPGNLQALRPFPELGTIFQRQHISNSVYHSLHLKAEKRFAKGLAFLASFVWSKSIDDADSVVPGVFESFGAQDERNLRLERGLSFFDVGRRISAGFVCDLPNRNALRPVLNNWQVSGIVTLQDGTPLNPVYFVFDPANSGTPNRPDVIPGRSVRLPRSQRSADRFFNADAFQAPRPFQFGNAGRNILPGPGNSLFDLAVHRRLPVREGHTVEFRAETFNTFNHPNFGIPGPYPDFGPFFGKIFSTGEPRRIQLALRYDF